MHVFTTTLSIVKRKEFAKTLLEWAILRREDISIIPPSLKTLDRKIAITQISGGGLCQCRQISFKLDAFDALNGTLQTKGYSLLPAAKCRTSKCLYQGIQEFPKKISSRLIGKAARDHLNNNKVYELCKEEAETGTIPKNVIDNFYQ